MSAVVLYFFTRTIFKGTPTKTSEKVIIDNIKPYLGTDLKLRIEVDD